MEKGIRSSKVQRISRRHFIKTAVVGTTGILAACKGQQPPSPTPLSEIAGSVSQNPVVSIVKIKGGKIETAVEAAIDLLGGIETVVQGKERIMLKPNLVSSDPRATTDPQVVRSLAKLMKKAGKAVSIGEGSAAAGPGRHRRHDGDGRQRSQQWTAPTDGRHYRRHQPPGG